MKPTPRRPVRDLSRQKETLRPKASLFPRLDHENGLSTEVIQVQNHASLQLQNWSQSHACRRSNTVPLRNYCTQMHPGTQPQPFQPLNIVHFSPRPYSFPFF